MDYCLLGPGEVLANIIKNTFSNSIINVCRILLTLFLSTFLEIVLSFPTNKYYYLLKMNLLAHGFLLQRELNSLFKSLINTVLNILHPILSQKTLIV